MSDSVASGEIEADRGEHPRLEMQARIRDEEADLRGASQRIHDRPISDTCALNRSAGNAVVVTSAFCPIEM